MIAVVMTRVDPDKNMSRFYKVDVQPTLLGEWAVVLEWGRIGRGGTVRSTAYKTADAADAASRKQQIAKLRRGYVRRP